MAQHLYVYILANDYTGSHEFTNISKAQSFIRELFLRPSKKNFFTILLFYEQHFAVEQLFVYILTHEETRNVLKLYHFDLLFIPRDPT